MKQTAYITAENLESALLKASEEYNIPKEKIQYTVIKDAKSGVFGIIPQRDIEIEVVIASSPVVKKSTKKGESKVRSKAKTKSTAVKQSGDEELTPLAELSSPDREMTLAIVQEVISKIIAIVSQHTIPEYRCEENTIYVYIESNEDTNGLIGKDLEILKAIQYIIYKIVTQHIRCLFSLHIAIGEIVASEETLLVTMVNKLIEKVKATQKTQRTYPLNAEQRAVVHTMIEQEPNVIIKKEKGELALQPIILLYSEEKLPVLDIKEEQSEQ